VSRCASGAVTAYDVLGPEILLSRLAAAGFELLDS